jgi:hypothetical protein
LPTDQNQQKRGSELMQLANKSPVDDQNELAPGEEEYTPCCKKRRV